MMKNILVVCRTEDKERINKVLCALPPEKTVIYEENNAVEKLIDGISNFGLHAIICMTNAATEMTVSALWSRFNGPLWAVWASDGTLDEERLFAHSLEMLGICNGRCELRFLGHELGKLWRPLPAQLQLLR